MEYEHVISGLVRRRAEIAGRIDAAQDVVRALTSDLAHLDATIRLFQPDINLSGVRVRPVPGHHAALYGEMTRAVQTVLRKAMPELLPVREIAMRLMREKGLSLEDGKLVNTIHNRVGSVLRTLKHREAARCERGYGLALVWQLVTE